MAAGINIAVGRVKNIAEHQILSPEGNVAAYTCASSVTALYHTGMVTPQRRL